MEEIFKFAQWRVGAKAGATGNTMLEFMRDDQELLRQLAKGNEKAFKTLYDRYQGPIYRFALHMSGNRATAEETTQEVFTRIITNSKGYDATRGSVGSYLFGIARNIARRALQDVSSEVALEEESLDQDEFAVANGLDVLQDLTNTELVTALRAAVLALPQQYREAVVLCDLEEISYQEAAELLQCSPGTIASRVHRGRNILKKKLSCEKCVK
ncbi:MAG TPA: RNA polymerase sigma factor [Candidatus Angelobacter sp.]|nr:RNA polymerase sigma factor [Candidatus Angelobacter sp.]